MTREEIQNDALATLKNVNRGTAAISMGVGKTLIGLQHLHANYSDTIMALVAVPKKAVMQSWIDDAKKFNVEHLLEHIKFTTYRSLPKHNASEYDIVYLDECHNLLSSHVAFLNNAKRIIGLTGTPPTNEKSERYQLVEAYCPVIYKYETDDAVQDGILNDYKIIVHKLELDGRKNFIQKTRKGSFPTSEFAVYQYWTKTIGESTGQQAMMKRILRMKALMTFPSKELYAKRLFNSINEKVILFVNTKEQADILCKDSYHSSNKDSEFNLARFKSGEITKLSCVLQLSEGVNIPGLKQGIIMHAYGNEKKAAQRLGRLLRLNPDETATIHILCYEHTVDEEWVRTALEQYDQSKITYYKNGKLQSDDY
jgi:superfamily II DNA or RNA helicase